MTLPATWYFTGNPARGQYVKAIWQAFVEQRGSDFPEMSSAEWDMACGWFDQGIPLRVVLQGMQECTGRPRRLTLSYLRPAIEAEAKRWSRSMTA